MSGVFILKRSGTQFMYNLKSAGNGEVVLTSERYTSKQGAENGISSVKINAPIDGRYSRLIASDGSQYFNLKAGNGEIVGTSERYTSVAGRDGGINWVKANAPSARTEDQC